MSRVLPTSPPWDPGVLARRGCVTPGKGCAGGVGPFATLGAPRLTRPVGSLHGPTGTLHSSWG